MERLGLIHPGMKWYGHDCNSMRLILEKEDALLSDIKEVCQDSLRAIGTFSAEAAALTDWPDVLEAARKEAIIIGGSNEDNGRSGISCPVHLVHDHGSLLALACRQDLPWLLSWLSAQPSVKWVAPAPELRLHNLIAGAITQTGALRAGQDAASRDLHPFWAAGIDGSGQVLGCGDSGVDVDNCYFYDESVPFSVGLNVYGSQVFLSTTHRKLALYLGLQDLIDGNGHGSHTAGTLVGSVWGMSSTAAEAQPTPGTGVAPGAKLAFMDLSRGTSDLVWTPNDLASGYYPFTYGVGARVHSDSWGSSMITYDAISASVDRFTWRHPDFLPIFAAGNYGADPSGSASTVTTPSISKNCISVGATPSFQSQYQSPTTIAPVYLATLTVAAGAQPLFKRTFRVLQASFGPQFLPTLNGRSLPVVAASPQDACNGLSGASGAVVIATRSNCQASTKAQVAQAALAVALIVTNDATDGYFAMTDGGGGGSNIPVGGVPISTGRWLWLAAQPGQQAMISFSVLKPTYNAYDDVASYSSFGPTPDGRFKPDIVAPGDTVSASSNGQLSGGNDGCGTKRMQGTSMAAPVVAGSAALVRQWFAQGFYPTFSATPANAYNASGVLVKAVMLGGAVPMEGNVVLMDMSTRQWQSQPLEEPPSFRQGFGRLDLSRALPLSTVNNGWNIQVVDLATLTQGKSDSYCIYATGGPLHVTLAWYDYPADPNAASVLVNNLDLTISAEGMGGMLLQGNGFKDAINTVETIAMESMPAGSVAITVTATAIFAQASPQPYALVVLGAFTGVLSSSANPMAGASSASGGGNNGASCTAALTLISDALSTPSVSAVGQVSFYFSVPAGAAFIPGYQCRLSDSQGSTTGGKLHDWRTCTSPDTYSGLNDGYYTFQVRPLGQGLADTRKFVVDSTPPVVFLSSTLPGPAVGAPSPVTSQDSVTFNFTAADLTAVKFTCTLSLSAGAPQPPYLRTSQPGLNLGIATSCTSPLTIWGLYFGTYTFMVTGTDVAGNTASGTTVTWAESFTSGVIYSRVASSPPPLTNKTILSFTLYSFEGKGPTTPPILRDAYSMSFQSQMQLTGGPAGSWTTSLGPALSMTVSQDGLYTMNARYAGTGAATPSDAYASSSVTVDTKPPTLVIMSKPAAIQPDPVVTIKFQTSPINDAVAYYCRWLTSVIGYPPSGTSDSGSTAFGPCTGPTPTSSTNAVSNGYWLFQVKAQDEAGNLSPPLDIPFRTDTATPAISVSAPAATNLTNIGITYTLNAGAYGAGIANTSCILSSRWVSGSPALSSTSVATTNRSLSDSSFSSVVRRTVGETLSPCATPLLYSLAEGLYIFNIYATSNAGLRSQISQTIVVDASVPVTELVTKATLTPNSSQVNLEFISRDLPSSYNSGVNTSLCWLNFTGSSGVSFTTGRQKDGTPLIFNTGYPCTSPWSYSNLQSGVYTFNVGAVDNAGNTGLPSSLLTFTVDASLPINGTGAAASPGGSGEVGGVSIVLIAIVAGVGSVLIVAIIIGAVMLKRRARRNVFLMQPLYVGGRGPNRLDNNVPRSFNLTASYAGHTSSDEMLRYWEEERVRVAIQASIEAEQTKRAMQLSMIEFGRRDVPSDPDQARLHAAIQASLAEQRRREEAEAGGGVV